MAGNFKYGLYDKSAVTPGYFGTPKTSSSDDRLRELGILEDEPVQATGLSASIKEANEPSVLESVGGFLTGVKETVEEPLKEVVQGGKTLVDDIKLLKEGRVDEMQGLLGEAFQGGEQMQKNIKELNNAIDETGGNMFDKTIGFGLNVVGAGVDFGGDLIVSSLKTLAPEGLERATEEGLQNFLQTDFGKGTVDFIKTGGDKYEAFKQSSPEANRLGLTIESLLPVAEIATGGATGKVVKEVGGDIIEAGVKVGGDIIDKTGELATKTGDIIGEGVDTLKVKAGELELPSIRKTDDDVLLENLGLQTEKGIVNGVEVDIPKIDRTLSEKLVGALDTKTSKELAGRAVSPRTVGKNAKQKLKSVADVEKNTNSFYNNVRTGVLDGDISTLEDAAQTIVNNIDTVGARIGNAVKKVDGEINMDNELTDSIVDALNTKGSKVSPATTVLRNFFEELGNGKLTVDEAYEMKKAYSNEVTKLFKSGDAGTKQFKALSDGVQFLNTKIDEIIDTQLGAEFANDKVLFRELKTLVDDMVSSALVEGRKSPDSFAERIGKVESLFSPVNSVKQKLIKTADELNQRGGAWKELIRRYDSEAVKNASNK